MAVVARLRVDKLAATSEQVNAYLEARNVGGFGVLEYGTVTEKEHYHYVLEGFEDAKAVQAMRMDIRRKLGLTKTNYSLKSADEPERYERYCCKGPRAHVREPPIIIWRHSLKYTLEFIAQRHDEYWEENATNWEEKKKKSTGVSMVDTIAQQAKEAGLTWKDGRDVGRLALRELRARRVEFDVFRVKRIVNAARLQLCHGTEVEDDFLDSMGL